MPSLRGPHTTSCQLTNGTRCSRWPELLCPAECLQSRAVSNQTRRSERNEWVSAARCAYSGRGRTETPSPG
jgi:hypothetical protein